jgi:hypothetical protein
MHLRPYVLGVACVFAACSSSHTDGPPATVVPAPPPDGTSPDDLGFHVDGAKAYYIVPNGLVAGDKKIALTVTAPQGTASIDAFVDGAFLLRATPATGTIEIALGALSADAHEILLSVSGKPTAFARVPFVYTHPYYVFVSNDWDASDNDPTNKVWTMEQSLHDKHAELHLTHFVGPYTFTDPMVTEARRQEIVAWLKNNEQKYGDEIGLHIHPFCNFVTAAGVTCRTVPNGGAITSLVDTQGDGTGYKVLLEAYTSEELATLFKKADALFMQYGLAKPTSFRAGAWAADLHVLKALNDDGFVTDASGCNWMRIQQYWGGYGLGDWTKANWMPIGDMSQPYYPSQTDILSTAAPHFSTLEVPDNGILVDYITGKDMVKVFDENWTEGTALASPKLYSIGYHPVSLVRAGDENWLDYLHTAMDHADQYLASAGNGPVVYVRGSDIPKGWPATP